MSLPLNKTSDKVPHLYITLNWIIKQSHTKANVIWYSIVSASNILGINATGDNAIYVSDITLTAATTEFMLQNNMLWLDIKFIIMNERLF